MKNIFLFFLILGIFLKNIKGEVKEVGCLIWKNSFLKIQKHKISETNQPFIFTVASKQEIGYISIGFFSKPNAFEDSTSIIGFPPNNFLQLKNHTQKIKQKTIFGETFQKIEYNKIDGIFLYTFKMNSSIFNEKNFLIFSQNNKENPIIKNDSIYIPKHNFLSNFRFFQLNLTSNSIPICNPKLNIPGRITTVHSSIFILTNFIYIFVLFLFVKYRNDQPFKSRFLGPHIALLSNYLNFIFEFTFGILSYETTSNVYCILRAFLTFGAIQFG